MLIGLTSDIILLSKCHRETKLSFGSRQRYTIRQPEDETPGGSSENGLWVEISLGEGIVSTYSRPPGLTSRNWHNILRNACEERVIGKSVAMAICDSEGERLQPGGAGFWVCGKDCIVMVWHELIWGKH
jgi:hypothetical protein